MPRKKAVAEPTTTARQETRSNAPAFFGSLIFAGFVVIGGAIYLGTSDDGEINVTAAISNSNQQALENGGDPADQVGVVPEAFRDMTNGGLVPTDAVPTDAVPPQGEMEGEATASSTATSTESGEVTSESGSENENVSEGESEVVSETEETNTGTGDETLEVQ